MKHILTVWYDTSVLFFTDFWMVEGRVEYFHSLVAEFDSHEIAMDVAQSHMNAGASKAEIRRA